MPSAADYDLVPYESHAFPISDPAYLFVLGHLFSLTPSPPEEARILELGCASGGNIIPLAERFPRMDIVGIDFSERHISDGQALINRLGLTNVSLRHADISQVNKDGYGAFDYIICHGVFTNVGPEIQTRIMEICRDQLTDNGIAYIGYNTYPGWHLRNLIGDMMRYHTGAVGADAATQIEQARALLQFLAQNANQAHSGAYKTLLTSELNLLQRAGDYYLRYEHLAEGNSALYFHQFMELAHAHQLQYLAEADIATMLADNLPAQVAQTLAKVAPDIVRMEQYMDFLRNRSYRLTLVTHAKQKPIRALDGERLRGLRLGGLVKNQERTPDGGIRYTGISGACANSTNPDLIRVMGKLIEAQPYEIEAAQLIDSVPLDNAVLGAGTQRRERATAQLLTCLFAGLIRLYGRPSQCATAAGAVPITTALAREQARAGHWVTTLRHESIKIDEFHRQILRRLDGSTDIDTLTDELTELVNNDELRIAAGGESTTDRAATHSAPAQSTAGQSTAGQSTLAQSLAGALDRLAKLGLIVAPAEQPAANL